MRRLLIYGLAGTCWAAGFGRVEAEVPEAEVQKIKAAVPATASAQPQHPRKLLVFSLCKGFRHRAIPHGVVALQALGEKTGAYQAVVSDDLGMFKAEKLREFDVVCFNNSTGELFEDEELRRNLLEFVRNGGGVVGIHAATDACYEWPEYGELLGGYFDGHPWFESERVTVKVDDPSHPINAAFGGKPFEVVDEIYQFRAPYSREKLRVLLSLDTDRTEMTKEGIKRQDADFAVSWVRAYGKGRVFYCSLGHREDIYWNPTLLRHYLDGIQFALGDLAAPVEPSGAAKESEQPIKGTAKPLDGMEGVDRVP